MQDYPQPAEMDISTALDFVARSLIYVLRKNTALIDAYVYPQPIPSELAAFEQRLKSLQKRVKRLQELPYHRLRGLIDDVDCTAARYLAGTEDQPEIIGQLLAAIFRFQRIIEDYYERSISQRAPYAPVYEPLQIIQQQLRDMTSLRLSNRYRRRAENEARTGSLQFCTGAVRLINDVDRGRVSRVHDRELFRANRAVLARYGGDYLWWTCSTCKFKLRFHVEQSRYSQIRLTDEIREHEGVPMQYRSIFLAKSHLHLPRFDDLPRGSPKYGCVFCFAEGRLLNHETTFESGLQLAIHICSNHKDDLPHPIILDKFKVSVNDRVSPHTRHRQFEVNLRTA